MGGRYYDVYGSVIAMAVRKDRECSVVPSNMIVVLIIVEHL